MRSVAQPELLAGFRIRKSKTLLAAATLALHVTGAHADGAAINEHLSPGGARFVLATVPEADDLVIQVAWPTDWAVDRDIDHAVPVLAAISLFSGGVPRASIPALLTFT